MRKHNLCKMYFKVNSDNHYTIRANIPTRHHNIFKLENIETIMLRDVGFEPTRRNHQVDQILVESLKSGSLDHSDNHAVNILKTYLGLAPRED